MKYEVGVAKKRKSEEIRLNYVCCGSFRVEYLSFDGLPFFHKRRTSKESRARECPDAITLVPFGAFIQPRG